jgi:hypothetical protein
MATHDRSGVEAMSTTHGSDRWGWKAIGLAAFGAALVIPAAARADGPLEGPAPGLLGLLSLAVLLAGLGLGFGCLGATVGHLFAKRVAVTFKVLCRRPGWSLLAGALVTLLGLGLLVLLHGAKPLALLVLLGYLGSLLLFAVAAATRLAGRLVGRGMLEDELPDVRLLLQGGLVLVAVNAVPILGTLLFVGILLAAVGASLLGYFTKVGPTPGAPAPSGVAGAAPDGSPPAAVGAPGTVD